MKWKKKRRQKKVKSEGFLYLKHVTSSWRSKGIKGPKRRGKAYGRKSISKDEKKKSKKRGRIEGRRRFIG